MKFKSKSKSKNKSHNLKEEAEFGYRLKEDNSLTKWMLKPTFGTA